MIRGMHGLFYSSDPEATRAFFRETVRLPGKDTGGGWWVFDFAEGDMGVHPVDDPTDAGGHDVSLYCDDIHGTVADMKARGVTFIKDVADHGYGLVTYFTAPGGITIQLYEARYKKLGAPRRKVAAARKAPAKRKASAPKRKPSTHKTRVKKNAGAKKKTATRRARR